MTLPDVLAALDELGLPALAAVQARVSARLAAIAAEAAPNGDRQLDVAEAAPLIGISESMLYKTAKSYPFTVRIGRKLLFSERGIREWLAMRRQT